MRAFDDALPEAPRLVQPEVAAATAQVKETDKDGGPLEALSTCRWCGGMHPTACPYIKIAEWHPSGQLARVVLKERVAQEKAILYPYEDDEDQNDVLRRALNAIAEATSLEAAQQIATTLVKLMDEEKPT